jgi:hypothetical protein
VAVIVTALVPVTGVVLNVNCAEVAPCGIVTEAGTVKIAGRLLESATTSPLGGAGELITTVLFAEEAPPPNDFGKTLSV